MCVCLSCTKFDKFSGSITQKSIFFKLALFALLLKCMVSYNPGSTDCNTDHSMQKLTLFYDDISYVLFVTFLNIDGSV